LRADLAESALAGRALTAAVDRDRHHALPDPRLVDIWRDRSDDSDGFVAECDRRRKPLIAGVLPVCMNVTATQSTRFGADKNMTLFQSGAGRSITPTSRGVDERFTSACMASPSRI
jgi:hypothetical protein